MLTVLKITVEIEAPQELQDVLTVLCQKLGIDAQAKPAAAPADEAPKPRRKPRAAAKKAEPETSEPEAKASEATKAEAVFEEPTLEQAAGAEMLDENAVKLTVKDVREALMDLVEAKGHAHAPVVLADYGVTKVSELSEDQYADVIATIKAKSAE